MPSSRSRRFSVLIPAAGHGVRMGAEIPKQYLNIGRQPIIRHTVSCFLFHPGLNRLRVVIDPDHLNRYSDALGDLDLPAPIQGGLTRKQSVINGLSAFSDLLDEDVILIHDAVRPFIDHRMIDGVLDALEDHEAVCPALPVSDTLRFHDGAPLDRHAVRALQTPQGFRLGALRRAAGAAGEGDATDETALILRAGGKVHYVEGGRRNIKITTPEDLEMAEKLMGADRRETLTAWGFDVHAFDLDGPETEIRLGGIMIPSPHPLRAHSDGDVLLHALTDAILGLAASGDIGAHFPPGDPRWKDRDSRYFLGFALDTLAGAGGSLRHVDATLVCERPRIGPHREALRTSLAALLALPLPRVSVKATTTEGLGFTGRGEGIAAQAMATAAFLPGGAD